MTERRGTRPTPEKEPVLCVEVKETFWLATATDLGKHIEARTANGWALVSVEPMIANSLGYQYEARFARQRIAKERQCVPN